MQPFQQCNAIKKSQEHSKYDDSKQEHSKYDDLKIIDFEINKTISTSLYQFCSKRYRFFFFKFENLHFVRNFE